MLFNSYVFIFLFFPIVLTGFFLLGVDKKASAWLALASVFFYAYWNPPYVLLLLASALFNFWMGQQIALSRGRSSISLQLAVFCNLALLGYFKYVDFFAQSLGSLTSHEWRWPGVILPLGVSFFTFTQIAYLVDMYRRPIAGYSLTHYLLFVTYFPHLIAGPILHHAQMMPQFKDPLTYRPNRTNIEYGLTYFALGLGKKILLADLFAKLADPVFQSLQTNSGLPTLENWVGVLAYTLQLYFDFSAYSDMAIGLSKCLNIDLPINFNSPYKSRSIIEFWRRWHMTLSQFLRDYLYILLGGNAAGPWRQALNIWITMLLGGLWHGAGWTYVVWGGFHGFAIGINHLYRKWSQPSALRQSLALGLTFAAVVVGWVFFRSPTLRGAMQMIHGLFTTHFGFLPTHATLSWGVAGRWIAMGLLICWFTPNTQELMKDRYAPHWRWALATGVLFAICLVRMAVPSTFIYFQF